MRLGRTSRAVIAIAVAIALVHGVRRSGAESLLPRASFSYFNQKPESALSWVVLKLTWGGRMTQQLPSVVLHVSADTVNTDVFLPFEEPNFPYDSDESFKLSAHVTAH